LQKFVLVFDIEDLYLIKAKTREDGAVLIREYHFADFTMERGHKAGLVLKRSFLSESTVEGSLGGQYVNIVA